ncbi:MAG: ATP-binding cassette domain-containing protein [Oceanospirillaceae bacterium]|nr:ATP-binding cassette domain-containing protein [Oceanospirillaceae bacterium]
MALIQFDQVCLSLGPRAILDHVDLQIEAGERVALVGSNGAGKSTLLSIVAKRQDLDSGTYRRDPTARIAELPQSLPAADERSVRSVVAEGLADLQALRQQYDKLLEQGESADLSALERLQHELEASDAWYLEQRLERVMTELDLPADKLMSELSGGWRRRAALGAALVQQPDLLLLDEPTNHLDIETIEWLEQVLLNFRGGLLFISHDRALVDRIATRIVELDRGSIASFPGNYTQYLERKQKMLEDEARHNAEFDKKLAQEERWIRQGIKARRTRNEGRVRALKQLRVDRAERRERQGKARFDVEEAVRSGKLVTELKGVNLNFGEQKIIDQFSLRIQRGDRIGLIGPNGAGKSSLLRVILGQQEPDQGSVRIGSQLVVGYFDQLRGQLDPEKSIIDNVSGGRESIDINGRSRHIISYLQDFLFTPERARTPVKALSGGETNRVMLAKLFSQPSNLLVLDEPTNDLDVETLELLEEILTEYQGTLLLVSHDRQFLDNIVTSTIVFEGEGKISEYVGGYSDWVRQRPAPVEEAVEFAVAEATKVADKPKRSSTKLSYKLQRELDALPQLLEEIESEVEAQQAVCSASDFYQKDHESVAAELAKLSQLEQRLEELMERWVELEAMQEGG